MHAESHYSHHSSWLLPNAYGTFYEVSKSIGTQLFILTLQGTSADNNLAIIMFCIQLQ